ncbi:MAG TPA: thiol:disulfide interchange protein DsbA/DsbL [Nevskiaceae bacterium]|nr:thiol:disulfide interchange protein DsbA/DsbL [Nevskiaceae bacterium]
MRSWLRPLFVALSLTTFACSAQTGAFKEGEHYKKVREAQSTPDPKRILVEEIFWYGCGHCFAFDPIIKTWAASKPADVDFVQIPTSLGYPHGVLHQKAFYTAESLKLFDKVHKPLFEAIHVQRQAMNTEAQISSLFVARSGVLPDVFAGTFNGFAVDAQVRRADQRTKAYGISSVPTIVVNGQYYTSAPMAGGFEQMLQVVNQLIEQARKARS